jgi:hypothetical protein
MLQILLPVAVALLAGTAYVMSKKPEPGVMNPNRQAVLDTALTSKDIEPAQLRALAKVFTDNGLPLQADLLEKRAKLRELPPDVKEARKAAFRTAMESTNADGIRVVADAFEKEGATGAATALRKRAFDLDHPTPAAVSPAKPVNTSTVAEQAAQLIQQREALPVPSASPDAAIAATAEFVAAQAAQQQALAQQAEALKIAAINAAIASPGNSPESNAVIMALADLPNLSSGQ